MSRLKALIRDPRLHAPCSQASYCSTDPNLTPLLWRGRVTAYRANEETRQAIEEMTDASFFWHECEGKAIFRFRGAPDSDAISFIDVRIPKGYRPFALVTNSGDVVCFRKYRNPDGKSTYEKYAAMLQAPGACRQKGIFFMVHPEDRQNRI